MGYYMIRVIPAGAILVGAVASSGYGLASWFSGVKITKRLLWAVLVLQVGGYFAAQYIEFASLHLVHRGSSRPVGFFEYYDLMARSFAWEQETGASGQPVGVWGYLFRALEVAGFAVGGICAPAIMRGNAYCENCQRYMQKRYVALIPAWAKQAESGDWVAQQENQNALTKGREILSSIEDAAKKGEFDRLNAALDQLHTQRKVTLKLPQKIILRLISCRACRSGQFAPVVLTGNGNYQEQSALPETVLLPVVVESLRGRPAAA